jgi:uncharacterized membrane protein
MLTVVLSVLGLILGAAVAEEEGVVFGLFIGLAFGMILSLKGRILELEQTLVKLTKTQRQPTVTRSKAEPIASPDRVKTVSLNSEDVVNETSQSQSKTSDYADIIAALQNKTSSLSEPVEPRQGTERPDQVRHVNKEPELAEKAFLKVKNFFTTGNVVVKVGAIVLFFGVAFLLKYAAERSMFPIELRLLIVMAFGIAMLVIGWRLRDERLEYGLILQGAGVGLLYLTVFAASKFYHVLPVSITFAIMLLLVALSGWLAVKQDAKSLAIFGVVGGFLAPVLMSTGGGSHIVLFTYYALLNVGILGISWFKSWRFLNLIGFVFTFIISAAWGYKAYQPEHFASTEFFLILFFFFFLAISILFAFKEAPKSKFYVDGTIVFGLPLVAYALQGELVKPFEYGDAITAIALAVIYLFLAKRLWLPEKKGVRLLAESFLALGITFASLAVPLLLDGRWTAAIWSLEGAALVWIGLRQSHIVTRGFGLLLSIGAGLAFISENHNYLVDSLPVLNSAFIGMVLISLSAILIAYFYDKYQQNCYRFERDLPIATIMVIWGLFWWFVAGMTEISHFVSTRFSYQEHSILLFIAVTSFVQAVISHKLSWSKITISFILIMPVMVGILLLSSIDHSHYGPLRNFGYLAWPAILFVHLLALRRKEQIWSKAILTTWHAVSVVVIALLIVLVVQRTFYLAWLDGVMRSSVWQGSTTVLAIAIAAVALMKYGKLLAWPIEKFRKAYYSWGLLPIMLSLVLWFIAVIDKSGVTDLIGYIPVLNPLDIVQALIIAVFVAWLWFINRSAEIQIIAMPNAFIYGVAGAMSFIWLNTIIARSVHFFAQVPYRSHALMDSTIYQSTTSIVWSLIAVLLMATASKKAMRLFWFAGAGLLALVVLKLFFVDLVDSGSISRIISFLFVGVLMLAIGYLSPLPPKKR